MTEPGGCRTASPASCNVCESLRQLRKGLGEFEPGEVGAEAIVDTATEGEEMPALGHLAR